MLIFLEFSWDSLAGTMELELNQPIVKDNQTRDMVCTNCVEFDANPRQPWQPTITPTPPGKGGWKLRGPQDLIYVNDVPFANSTKYQLKVFITFVHIAYICISFLKVPNQSLMNLCKK